MSSLWFNFNRLFMRKLLKVRARYCSSSSVCEAFLEECIAPDVVIVPPQELACVIYDNTSVVNLGNKLTPAKARNRPTVSWAAEENCYYTLCLVDPDVPCREEHELREWQHWLVVNIPGDDVRRGETLSAYIGPMPQEKTGLHRYVFLVYQQNEKICFDGVPILNSINAHGREKFSIDVFACTFQLGNPHAGNFYLAEHDCHVNWLTKKLGMKKF